MRVGLLVCDSESSDVVPSSASPSKHSIHIFEKTDTTACLGRSSKRDGGERTEANNNNNDNSSQSVERRPELPRAIKQLWTCLKSIDQCSPALATLSESWQVRIKDE